VEDQNPNSQFANLLIKNKITKDNEHIYLNYIGQGYEFVIKHSNDAYLFSKPPIKPKKLRTRKNKRTK